jgi:hypothetical protein
VADRPFSAQQTSNGTSDFEKGASTGPFLLADRAQAPAPGEEFFQLETFSVRELAALSFDQRQARYTRLLGPYEVFLRASAARNVVPPQLLAAIILNELNDISPQDLLGDKRHPGSIGMAQISVETARHFGLVDGPPLEALLQAPNAFAASALAETFTEQSRLRQPKFAIEAAARYIRHLVGQMARHRERPWQKLHGFSLRDASDLRGPQDLYRFFGPGGPVLLEERAAQAVAAAYNSPDIVIAQHPESIDPDSPAFIYRNGTIHGRNASFVAEDLAGPPALFH